MNFDKAFMDSWNVMNSLIGKKFWKTSISFQQDNEDSYKRRLSLSYMLTPEEIEKYGVSRCSGVESFSELSPISYKQNSERLERMPSYWLVENPFYAQGNLILLVEKLILDPADLKFPLEILGDIENTPLVFYNSSLHKTFCETCKDESGLIKRLSEVGMKPLGKY